MCDPGGGGLEHVVDDDEPETACKSHGQDFSQEREATTEAFE